MFLVENGNLFACAMYDKIMALISKATIQLQGLTHHTSSKIDRLIQAHDCHSLTSYERSTDACASGDRLSRYTIQNDCPSLHFFILGHDLSNMVALHYTLYSRSAGYLILSH